LEVRSKETNGKMLERGDEFILLPISNWSVPKGKTLPSGKVVTPHVKAGDKILYGQYSGSEIKIDDEEYLIMREEEVLGVIEEGKKK